MSSRLGVAPVPGGKHALMGTHNQLLGLGRETYLEVIAIDPAAPAPGRPRWFALDSPAMRSRLEKGPALIHWVARSDDIATAAGLAPVVLGEVVAAEMGRDQAGARGAGQDGDAGRAAELVERVDQS